MYSLSKRIMTACAGSTDSVELGNIALQIISIRSRMKNKMVRDLPVYKKTEIEEKLSYLQELEKSLVSLYLRNKIKPIQSESPRHKYKIFTRHHGRNHDY